MRISVAGRACTVSPTSGASWACAAAHSQLALKVGELGMSGPHALSWLSPELR